MSEKNDELINLLIASKLNWWDWFWKHLIGVVKVKSKDSSYQVYLNRIREDVVKKNSQADHKKDPAYQVYLDRVKAYLEARGSRLLTEKEEAIVVNHLEGVALAFENDPANSTREPQQGGPVRVGSNGSKERLDITQVLSIETAKKVSEIHEEFPNAKPESYDQRVAEVLAVQNYLKTEPVPRG